MEHIFVHDFRKSNIGRKGFCKIFGKCIINFCRIQIIVLCIELGDIDPVLTGCISKKFFQAYGLFFAPCNVNRIAGIDRIQRKNPFFVHKKIIYNITLVFLHFFRKILESHWFRSSQFLSDGFKNSILLLGK